MNQSEQSSKLMNQSEHNQGGTNQKLQARWPNQNREDFKNNQTTKQLNKFI